MTKTVAVHCSIPNGYTLRLFETRYDGYGMKHSHQINAVTIGCGVTRGIDAEFFGDWLAQNPDNSVVTSGAIYAKEE